MRECVNVRGMWLYLPSDQRLPARPGLVDDVLGRARFVVLALVDDNLALVRCGILHRLALALVGALVLLHAFSGATRACGWWGGGGAAGWRRGRVAARPRLGSLGARAPGSPSRASTAAAAAADARRATSVTSSIECSPSVSVDVTLKCAATAGSSRRARSAKLVGTLSMMARVLPARRAHSWFRFTPDMNIGSSA